MNNNIRGSLQNNSKDFSGFGPSPMNKFQSRNTTPSTSDKYSMNEMEFGNPLINKNKQNMQNIQSQPFMNKQIQPNKPMMMRGPGPQQHIQRGPGTPNRSNEITD
jgi:hypothetical protein